MTYPDAAWERAMTVQEVLLKALSGDVHWLRAAEILGWSPRTLRRWRERSNHVLPMSRHWRLTSLRRAS